MTTNPLDAIQARADAATAGPWKLWGMTVMDDPLGNSNVEDARDIAHTFEPDRGLRTFNATFIAHAREDVPKLVAVLRAVEALHQPSQVQRISYNHEGTIISYRNTDDGPCVACAPETDPAHCEACYNPDGECDGITPPWHAKTWPCPTITAIREALG